MEAAAPVLIGTALAALVGAFAALTGLDREQSFYPTVLIVIASYYGLFATMAGSPGVAVSEAAIFILFCGAAILGFKTSPWIVVVALCAHGAFDLVHSHVVTNPGTPSWWPTFCLAFDLTAAGCLAARIVAAGTPPSRAENKYERLIENSAL
jgi:hypothetical protein